MKLRDLLEELIVLDPETEVVLLQGDSPCQRRLQVKAVLPFIEHGQVIIRLG